MEAKAFLDAYFSIIENKTSWNTAKMVEHPLLSLQKALCVLIQAGHDKDVAAVAEPAAEYLDHFPFATQIDRSFTPIDLNSIAGIIFQRHICLRRNVLSLHDMDNTAHSRVRSGE